MHNCIASESIISCIRLILNWMRRQGLINIYLTEATQQGDTARCHFNLIIFILSSFNLQLYDTGSLIFTKYCPQCLHHLASVSSQYSLGPANYLTQLLTTVQLHGARYTMHLTDSKHYSQQYQYEAGYELVTRCGYNPAGCWAGPGPVVPPLLSSSGRSPAVHHETPAAVTPQSPLSTGRLWVI